MTQSCQDQVDFSSRIIPSPQELHVGADKTTIDKSTVIVYDKGLQQEAEYLAKIFSEEHGLELPILKSNVGVDVIKGSIQLRLSAEITEDEGYLLSIEDRTCTLKASSSAGVFYAIQTFLQLLPPDNDEIQLRDVMISDHPAFEHRGMLLDCCRHFFSIGVIKKYIDLLARYKMNVLHWHLTEDQGWRIEIDSYPQLTAVGAMRKEADGSSYGGYYTKAEIEEVVAYATKRHITVIPEIEMPGHSLAALAAYPALACTEGPFEVTAEWGVFKDVYCAGDENTFLFLEKVLDEVLEMFPSEYIHIGGDESPKFRWEHCDKCQQRMLDEGLKDAEELQAYFIRRIQDYLKSKGREIIGWDEILEGGITPEATVQSWRGMEGAVHAAQSGNKAILSPTSHCYLDYGLQSIDLEKIYGFDPIPQGLSTKEQSYIIGGECNMWTEHVPDEATLDNQILPRMIGLAEVLWTYDTARVYDEFTHRLQHHYPYLHEKGFDYGFEKVPVGFETRFDQGDLVLARIDQLDGITCYYHDAEESKMIVMDSIVTLDEDATFDIHVEQHGRSYPKEFALDLSVHQALGIVPKASVEYSEYYTAGGIEGLTDGFKGTLDFRDGHWQGYAGNDVSFDLDLGSSRSIREVGAHFYQYNNAWIFPPRMMYLSTSIDGRSYTEPMAIAYNGDVQDKMQSIVYLSQRDLQLEARYVRFALESMGPLPAWHDAAGSDSWIFIDELIIK